ncbi:MAG: cation diffusion facilitator family transporter [Candidatus Krumholzibacteria bacterium]|jgi:cation diffusion facilitator family transporter|nr:cation diffusion facilitator family transporter [Candidatus Krumholzibacteria bacterium]
MPVDLQAIPRHLRPTECTLVGMAVNLVLTGAKLVGGFLFRSAALVADGVHSFADLVSDGAVLLALRASRRPPDTNHPYGHESFESLGAIAVAIFMLVTGVLIGRDAVLRLFSGDNLQPAVPAFITALGSVVVKEWLARYTLRAAHLTHSPALHSNGQMHRADALTSVAAAAGILGAVLGLRWLDSLGALVISSFVLREGWRLTQQNLLALLDTMPDADTVQAMYKTATLTTGVRAVLDLKVRQRGAVFHADLRVAVDPDLSVALAHDLAHTVEAAMRAEFRELSRVFVHVEPHLAPPAPAVNADAGPVRRA